MKLNRRQFLKLGALAGAAVTLPQIALAEEFIGDARPKSLPRGQRFKATLPLPRILTPIRQDETTDYYEMTMRVGQKEIIPGKTTTIWGYEGEFPGPTIRARRGRKVSVRHNNGLETESTVHLHGGLVPPEMDGMPMSPIFPGGSREYVYDNDQPGSTLWYHDHALDLTGRNCYMGLCAFYILTDELDETLPLPKGEYDVPLAICDRTFNQDGSFTYPEITDDVLLYGALGDTILVNGAIQPRMEVANRKYRFRILNASNARPYQLSLASGQSLVQVGSDGGLLAHPVERQSIRIDSAERVEVVIDFSAYPVGTRVILKNLMGTGSTADIMAFDVTREEADDSSVPADLRPIEAIDPGTAVIQRNIDFGFDPAKSLWLINGKPYDHHRIDFRPQLGTTEIWSISNGGVHDHTGIVPTDPGMDHSHPFHIHGAFFQILDRNGAPPPAWEQGWKDTVSIGPLETVRVMIPFVAHAGTYMFHCHKLEHEDRGMMGHFEIVN